MKKLVIDGHNLIPKLPGLNLSDADDEARLLDMLQEYCRIVRCQVELFFDGSPDPDKNRRKHGLVHAHFIKLGYSADDAIIAWLRAKGSRAREYGVVTSDRRIQAEVRALGASVTSSDEFALDVRRAFNSPARVQEMREKPLSNSEVEDWLDFFNSAGQDQRK